MTILRIFLALIAALVWLAPGQAQEKPTSGWDDERILSFASDIAIARDGSLDVTENIRVRARGDRIQRGIYRDFPTRYRRDGRTVRVGFHVDEVLLDGNEENWSSEGIDNGTRIRIGSEDVFVEPGEHTYTIRYRTTRQLGFFDTYDELYWNVTGNGWAFPVDSAEARIRLPEARAFGKRAFYTGAQGATERDAEVVGERPGEIAFRTTRPLAAGEGMTIAVAWPKGVVDPPAPISARDEWMEREAPLIAGALALAALGFYYFHAWRRAGRGPVAGTVVPLFAPPPGISAAAARYLREMGYDNRVFAAALVEAGVRGKLQLIEEDGGFFSRTKTRIRKVGDPRDLPDSERGALSALFMSGDDVEMDKKNHSVFGAAQCQLQYGLEAAYRGKMFLTNRHWAAAGLAVLGIAMLAVGAVVVATDVYGDPGLWLVPLTGIAALVAAIWTGGRSRFAAKQGNWLMAVIATLLAAAGVVALATTIAFAGESGRAWPVFLPLIALPIIISAFWWMAAPTREGRRLMDAIDGFEQYLSVTEEDRLDRLHPPEKTPELFERYLPYAIALEVENRWASRFANVLAAAAEQPEQRNRMSWYSGSNSPWSDPGRFATAMGGALASSASAASTAPGSSSGSGGGGSSGGGGGGGGGGGW